MTLTTEHSHTLTAATVGLYLVSTREGSFVISHPEGEPATVYRVRGEGAPASWLDDAPVEVAGIFCEIGEPLWIRFADGANTSRGSWQASEVQFIIPCSDSSAPADSAPQAVIDLTAYRIRTGR